MAQATQTTYTKHTYGMYVYTVLVHTQYTLYDTQYM